MLVLPYPLLRFSRSNIFIPGFYVDNVVLRTYCGGSGSTYNIIGILESKYFEISNTVGSSSSCTSEVSLN